MTNLAVVPRAPTPSVTFSEMQSLATSIAKSGLFGMKTPEQALALMAIAQAEGRHPAMAARDYDIIQGRPAKKAEAMMRDFIEAGGKVEWHALDDTQADATFSHPSGGTVRITWDAARAKQAQLTGKDMYKKYPRQMFRSRCVSEGVRTVCPAATSGLYVPEEVADFDPKRAVDVTPSRPALTPPPAPPTELTEEQQRAIDREGMRDMRGETEDATFEEEAVEPPLPHVISSSNKTPKEWGIELVGYYAASKDLPTLMAWRAKNEKLIDQLGPKAIESLAKAYKARYDAIIATMEPAEPVLP